jgi:hypothetical protein
MDRTQDPAQLRRLVTVTDWPTDLDPDALALGLLENFRSPDPVLRDELSYALLARLVEERALRPETIRTLLRRAVDEAHLFFGIGRNEDPSVFGRSFSVLVVPLVWETPEARRALRSTDVEAARAAVLRYTYDEQDRRGYVPGHGWAHSAAHTADALAALGLDPMCGEVGPVLDALCHLATLPCPLAFREDDRIAWAVFQLVKSRRVSVDDMETWLNAFQPSSHPTDVAAAVLADANAAHTLRSLYFRLLEADPRHPLLDPALRAVRRLDPFAAPEA